MQVKRETDKLDRCICGHKPTEYWIGYSRTPYYVNCECGKHVGGVGGSPQNIINKWNENAPLNKNK